MTQGLLIELVLSIAGVGLLVAVSWMLGAWRNAFVTANAAADRLAFDEPDFAAREWLVGADGKAAAARSADGAEIALVFALGDSFATRRLARRQARVEQRGAALRFALGEVSRRAVYLTAPDEAAARRWLSLLTGDGV
ncbi:MAG TPA: hypothetical protein DDZ68_07220 [Parvularcula sp.]|nr:hypothetical protein [Parvularcula sp.]HBS31564.1 hypothetical protein [Parvularcula sp.]